MEELTEPYLDIRWLTKSIEVKKANQAKGKFHKMNLVPKRRGKRANRFVISAAQALGKFVFSIKQHSTIS